MSNIIAMGKCTLNVAFIACILWSTLVAFLGISGFLGGRVKWDDWFFDGVLTALGGYVAVAVISYIFWKSQILVQVK